MSNAFANVDTASASFITEVDNCDWNNPSAVAALIASPHTPQAFREDLLVQQFNKPTMVSYFRNFFGFEDWDWGQGGSKKTETYHAPVLATNFHRWLQKDYRSRGNGFAAGEDPSNLDDCIRCYEDLPTGGYSTQDVEFFEAGVRTQPYCISKIKSERMFWKWQDQIIRDQKAFEEQILTEFFLMCVIRYSGNKILLESGHPFAGTSARDILPDFPMAYRKKFFPQAIDPENIVPFDLSIAEDFAYQMIEKGNTGGAIGISPEDGAPIFEFWTDNDWRRSNILQDPDYADKIKYSMPEKLFKGYSLNSDANRMVFGNIAPRVMPALPRFADSSDGGITVVQPFLRVAVEAGYEAIPDPVHRDAPYQLVVLPSPNVGRILRPKPITTSQGIPITPLYGNAGWQPMNEYDKECNPKKNMPWWEWDADLGFAPRSPDESTVILSRRQVFKRRPQNTCNLMPRLCVDPIVNACGPDGLCDTSDLENVSQSITDLGSEFAGTERVLVTSYACGDTSIAMVKLTHKDKRANFVIDCACGSTLKALLKDGTDIVVKLIDNSLANPGNIYTVQRVDGAGDPIAFDDATCIASLICFDATPASAEVLAASDANTPGCGEFAAGEVEFVLDSVLSCGVGDAIEVDYVDASGAVITTGAGMIATANDERNTYVFTMTDPLNAATDVIGNAASVVRCV